MSEIDLNLNTLRIAVPEGHDKAQPIPLLIKSNPDDPNAWATRAGDKVFAKREWAEKAIEMDSEEYRSTSRKRIAASRLLRAEVVPVAATEYVYSDDVSGYNDGYFRDVDDIYDYCALEGVEVPAYVFATTEEGFEFDIEGSLDSYLSDNHHEDAYDQIVDWKELDEFWKAWSAKQDLKTYFVDYKRVIVLDQARYEAEIDDARRFLADHPL